MFVHVTAWTVADEQTKAEPMARVVFLLPQKDLDAIDKIVASFPVETTRAALLRAFVTKGLRGYKEKKA